MTDEDDPQRVVVDVDVLPGPFIEGVAERCYASSPASCSRPAWRSPSHVSRSTAASPHGDAPAVHRPLPNRAHQPLPFNVQTAQPSTPPPGVEVEHPGPPWPRRGGRETEDLRTISGSTPSAATSGTCSRASGTPRRDGSSQASAFTAVTTSGGKDGRRPPRGHSPGRPGPPRRSASATSTRCPGAPAAEHLLRPGYGD